MTGPAQNGVLVYSDDVSNLAEFYVQLFNMQVSRETKDFTSLEKDGFNLIIHAPPFAIPESGLSPVKVFLTVTDMTDTRKKATTLGGQAFDGEWANPLFKVSNIADRDGNHIQLRQFNRSA
ncbi:hypothetical protein OCL06_04085 [Alteromonas sp. ASW11-19]|uniref:VOC domain-containing protein n=1 Tax=Alteromonas salexigens TaxID=2982530 RepID=A0ABT2VKH4_9ALTE|nr:VOC family protein [Alteromonas salexigens]MCU7553777.1 hypothetical protein [Alteromonas salexigens]